MTFNFTGIWKADLSRSKLLGPSPKTIAMTIEHSDPALRQELVVTKHDGSEERASFLCQTDGHPGCSSLNGQALRGSARWEGGELVIESWLQFGLREVHLCDYWSLSPDGRTLTMEHRNDDLAGQITILNSAG